jgi:hypothetical protein
VVFAGCGGEPASPVANRIAAELSPPVLAFEGDWSVTQTGSLGAGGQAVLRYDMNRLPHCRGTGRTHFWSVTAYMEIDGRAATPLVLPSFEGVNELQFYVPFGRELALWFQNVDNGDCSEWDSKFGANFHFAVAPPSQQTLHFRSDFTVIPENIDAAGLAAGDLLIDFEIARLPDCRVAAGYASWWVGANYSFDRGASTLAPLTALPNGVPVPMPARLTVPAGARDLALWFENADGNGCHTWDSAYGSNYHFAIRP